MILNKKMNQILIDIGYNQIHLYKFPELIAFKTPL